MSTTNRVLLIGRVGKDLEVKEAGTTSICNVSFVTEDAYKGKDGTYQKSAEWHNCVAFGKTAESMAKFIKKGSALILSGKNHTSSWDDKKSGFKKYKTEIIIESWIFQQGSTNNSATKEGQPTEVSSALDIDNDMPF